MRGVARKIQHLDLLVGNFEIAAREFVVVDRLEHHRAIEEQERVVAARFFRQLLRAIDVEQVVHPGERLFVPSGVERGTESLRLVRVARAGARCERCREYTPA